MPGEIIFTVDPETNEVSIEVKGVKGKVCADLTAGVEKALGKVKTTKKTREYHDRTEAKKTVKTGR